MTARPRGSAHRNRSLFRAVPLWQLARLNPAAVDPNDLHDRGRAVASGRPRHELGTNLLMTLIREMRARRGRFARRTMRARGRIANVTIVEAL